MQSEIQDFLVEKLQSSIGAERSQSLSAENLFDLGLDSYAFVELVTSLEQQFEVRFDTEELLSPQFRSVMGIVSMVLKKKSG